MAPHKRKSCGSLGTPFMAPPSPESPSEKTACRSHESFVPCPTCGKSFASSFIQDHAWNCHTNLQPPNARNGQRQTHSSAKRTVTFIECPTCGKSFPQHSIEGHAWECLPPPTECGTAVGPPNLARSNCEIARKCNAEETDTEDSAHHNALGTERATLANKKGEVGPSDLGNSAETSKSAAVSSPGSFEYFIDGEKEEQRTSLCRRGLAEGVGEDAIKANCFVLCVDGHVLRYGIKQKLMEGGKRAVRAEREAKIVPRSWPVELIENVLPTALANRLLVCLLDVSRDWTTYAWFNNNGVEGRSHSRSRIYRLCKNNRSGSNDDNNSSDNDNAPNFPGNSSAFCSSAAAQWATSDSCAGAHGGQNPDADDTVGNMSRLHHRTQGGNTLLPLSCRLKSAGENAEDFPRRVAPRTTTDATLRVEPPLGTPGGRAKEVGDVGPGGRPTPCKSIRPETHEEFALSLDDQKDIAPTDLLEIVPRIVDMVRRRQRERVAAGLGGQENLEWNPNFCICHVYDDHRSNLGAHSDSLSSIGPNAIVTGISLGAKRIFTVQEGVPWGIKPPPASDISSGRRKFLDMPHNSAIVMWGGCQERYKHGVPALPKGVETHPIAGSKRISITLRERKEVLPSYLQPIPDCRCRVPATLKARLLSTGDVAYFYQCDRGQGQCGFMQTKARARS